MLKALFFSLFLFTEAVTPYFRTGVTNDCGNFKATFTTSKEESGTKLVIEVSGGSAPYKYIFYKQSGDLVSFNLDSNFVTGLPSGKYICLVVDKKNCNKTLEIEIN